MSKDPAFPFYTQDFLTGIMFMSNEEVGIYIKLLCIQHQHGGLIDKTVFNTMVKDSILLRTKFIETEDGLFNERLMKEMEKRQVKSTNLSANAKLRWDRYKSNANAMQKHNKCNASAMHCENENENEINKELNKYLTSEFEAIWNSYPKKDGKKAAFRHFMASVKDKAQVELLKQSIDNYKEYIKDTDIKYVKNGSTFFNCWEDWIEKKENQKSNWGGL